MVRLVIMRLVIIMVRLVIVRLVMIIIRLVMVRSGNRNGKIGNSTVSYGNG